MPSLGTAYDKLYEELAEARQHADDLALALITHFPEAGSFAGGCGAYRSWLHRSWAPAHHNASFFYEGDPA